MIGGILLQSYCLLLKFVLNGYPFNEFLQEFMVWSVFLWGFFKILRQSSRNWLFNRLFKKDAKEMSKGQETPETGDIQHH